MIICPNCYGLIMTMTPNMVVPCERCGAKFRIDITEVEPPKITGRDLIVIMNVNTDVKKAMLELYDERKRNEQSASNK